MNIIKLPSRNFYAPGSMSESGILAVVAHGTAGPLQGSLEWLRHHDIQHPERDVSSNYVISKAGVIYELVDPFSGKRAWANGLVDKVNFDRSITWLVDCVRRGINPNWHTVSIEHEASAEEMRLQRPMTDAQFNASIDLTALIMRRSGLLATHDAYVTHHQIAGNMKPTCPGVINPGAFREVLILRNPDLKP